MIARYISSHGTNYVFFFPLVLLFSLKFSTLRRLKANETKGSKRAKNIRLQCEVQSKSFPWKQQFQFITTSIQ